MTASPDTAAASGLADGAGLWRWAVWTVAGLTLLRWLVLALSPLELYGDEAQYWTWSRSFEFGYFTKPPLIAWLIAATTAVFGDGAFGVRFAAPLCHAIAALFIGLAARDLAAASGGGRDHDGRRVGALAMVTYATLPAVSYSSLIMSTDAPLLALWAVALWAFIGLLRTRGLGWAVIAGLAVAAGLNAKYAMGYFLLCAGLYALAGRDVRWLLRGRHGLVLVVVGLAGLAPNLLWNMANGWATVGHTADNANWDGPLLHPDKGIEFVAAQFGVFGPVLFALLLVLLVRWARGRAGADIGLCLAFAAPILGLITAQAFLSRAHANWAATAYVAATIAVVFVLIAPRMRVWLRMSLGLHGFVTLGLYVAVLLADVIPWPAGRDPFVPLRGWAAAGAAVVVAAESGGGGRIVVADDRMLLASLIHATRDSDLRFAAWDTDGVPGNHYELTIPYDRQAGPPALLVSAYPETVRILRPDTRVAPLPTVEIPVGADASWTLYLWAVN